MYFAGHEWKQNPTSPKVYRVGAQVYRSIRPFVYPGNCGIFAFCRDRGMPCRKSCIACARRLYQHYVCSISFLTSRFLGSSQSSQPVSSPRLKIAIATTSALRGTNNYSNKVQADGSDRKVCACRCRYGGQASRTPPTQ
jgi:hypothetical protein